ncbi:putative RNA-directed DNA polymerase [Tanacetum coccineum]|uniref:RNA-directed DNA polymerase n=1 Tax=Tanacetum coccineum TaxID=301880 RepID=A0ABQ4X6Q5_9ASTR
MSLHGYSDGEYDDGSDVDNVTLIRTENYQVWSCVMLLVLEGKNKTGFIDGSCRRSNTDEVLGRQWDRVNAVVLGWILNSISEELFLGQIFSKRAKHVWDELKETYDKVDGSMTFSLHHKIHTLSQNGSSIADYYHKLNALWKQFDALIELPRCTCHAADDFKKHNQLMKLMQFLMGLDDTYMQIRSSILSKKTIPDVKNAYAIISSEESHRIATGNFQRPQTFTSFSRLPNNNRPNDNGNRRTVRGSALVYPVDFGKRKASSNLKRKNVSNNVVGSSSSNGFFDEQMATLISLIKENSINGKGVHSNMAGTYMNSSTVFNKNFKKFFCSNSSLHSKLVSKGLITDSGANQHITYTDKNLINVINISYLKIKVTHPNRTEAFITRIRNMPLTDYLTLYDVLVLPEYCVSLMSVHKVARDSKLRIAFDEMHCYIWHCRLGHPANQVLDVLKHTLSFDNKNTELICDTCQGAKHTREPFPLSDHVSTELGELVHLDLWGPYKVTSMEGFKFFLTIVDDFSRAVWVYLLKSKNEVFHNIMVFYNLIKTQFKKNIKVFRSDNGTEFVNQQFYGFCESNGIIHQTLCSYTPQQNGIVDRKHRHLLNVARSLFFQGGIPLNMLSECVLTATYLINILPTSVLNGKSLYDLVYNKPPSLKHLRSFGYLAYATILNSHDKFGSRSEKCVLVGYLNSKKRYKLWSLDNKQVIYSKDVKFFEDIFTFKQNNSTGIDNSVQDANHLNFFNSNTLDDLPKIPNNEERRNPNPIRHGNPPSHSGRTFAFSNENDVGHSQDADASASENGSFAADEDNNSNSEGNGLHDQSQDNVSQDNNGAQILRRNYCFATMLNKGVEPKTYLEASQHKHWVDVMNAEMDALYRNNTWKIVDLPVRRKAISSKWVWKIKYKSDGEIERYKARLSGWSLFQMDINNTFLYGDLEETAPKQWNAKLTVALPENNFMQSKSDYSLFTKSFGDVFIALLVYVNDIIITGNSLTKIKKMQTGQGVLILEGLLLVIVYSCVDLWFPGRVKNKTQFQNPLQKLSIEL